MKNGIRRFVFVLVITVLFQSFSTTAEAKVYSYKLFDPMTVSQPSVVGGGRVAWWTQFPFHIGIMNRGGKMILSNSSDGTGNARVGDSLQIFANHSSHGTYRFTYNAYRPNCFFEDPPSMPPQDISAYFPIHNDPYDVTVRILDWCGKDKQTDALYLVNITSEPEDTPTLTPTPTVTRTTPTPVTPFLDLPWNYQSKGLSFTDAALRIEAFFDHEYPLLSAALQEPSDKNSTIVKFDGTRSEDAYSSHDGYDYAKRAQANIGEPVLAAAAGRATYSSACAACGHMILIDHENGFQTRYMHLSKDGLIVTKPGTSVPVAAGSQIGKIGFSGNVLPPGDLGAHIHFMVVEDKNGNAEFEDDIPSGIVDPFGWQGSYDDPWKTYTGFSSRYLWKHTLDSAKKTVTPNAEQTIQVPFLTVVFPQNTHDQTYSVQANATAYSGDNKSLLSVGNAFLLSAYNEANAIITTFKKSFTIKIDFKKTDVELVKPESLAIYSSQDGVTWQKEDTTVDLKKRTATTNVNHMTYFALLGERKDSTAPQTTVSLKGKLGTKGWYRSPVSIKLSAKDNRKGSGVDYTMYQINEGEWERYVGPIQISQEGNYALRFFSADKQGTIEKEQVVNFTIDTKIPHVNIRVSTESGEVFAEPLIPDEQVEISVKKTGLRKRRVTVTDRAGNRVSTSINWSTSPPAVE